LGRFQNGLPAGPFCQWVTISDSGGLQSVTDSGTGVTDSVTAGTETGTDSCTGNQAVRARGDLRAGFVKEIEVRVLALP
jgi:hypothetical protein